MALKRYNVQTFRDMILARKGVEEPTLDTASDADAWLDANAVAHLAALLQEDAQDVYNALYPHRASGSDLDEHARVWLETGRLVATIWVGRVELARVSGTNPPAPAGLELLSGDGLRYVTTQAVTAWGSDDKAVVTAKSVDKGAKTNKAVGAPLTVQSPPAGLQSAATFNATTTAAIDDESDEHLRSRLLLATRYRPGGGSPADYAAWTLEASSEVASCFVYPRWYDTTGGAPVLGTVLVCPLGKNNAHIPSATIDNVIVPYILKRQPVGAVVTVTAPSRTTTPVSVGVVPKTGYEPDWTATGGYLTVAALTTAEKVYYTGSPTGLAVGDRVVCAISTVTGGYEQRIVRSLDLTAKWVTVSPPFSATPATGSYMYPGGPLWQPVFDAILGVFYVLGASHSTDLPRPRWPPPSDGANARLSLADIYHAVESVPGVLASGVVTPASDLDNSVAAGVLPYVFIPVTVLITWSVLP